LSTRQSGLQDRLFYESCLEDRVPANHLLRKIDRVLKVDRLHELLAPLYSHTGRPSIDPELMIRVLLVDYCYGLRSQRRLCEGVSLNLAYRWFCRLGLEDEVPDHSTFPRTGMNVSARATSSVTCSKSVVRACTAAGLVGSEGFAVDASVVEATPAATKALTVMSPSTGPSSTRGRCVNIWTRSTRCRIRSASRRR